MGVKMIKMQKIWLLGLIIASTFHTHVFAQANILGIGTETCQTYLKNKSLKEHNQLIMAWFGGFSTGANAVTIANHQVFRNLDNIHLVQKTY
jgi:hypothetical protein